MKTEHHDCARCGITVPDDYVTADCFGRLLCPDCAEPYDDDDDDCEHACCTQCQRCFADYNGGR